MIKVSLSEQLISIENIHKNVNSITLKETISLVFHALTTMAQQDPEWESYYVDFQNEFNKQNKYGWPKLIFTRNYSKKRLDCLGTRTFISTNNILLMLLQLLYIETCKKYNDMHSVYLTFDRYEVLDHTINFSGENNIDMLTLDNLFEILEIYISAYIGLYDNRMLYENQLSRDIISQLKN